MRSLVWLLSLAPTLLGDVDGVRVVGQASAPAEVRGTDELGDVAWSTAPRVGARAILAVDPARARVVARAGDDPLIVVSGRGVAIAADLADASNAPLLRWGYWPYLLHAADRRIRGLPAERFADWPDSPVPHARLTSAFLAVAAGAALLLALAFAAARRRARAHPDEAARLFAPLAAAHAGAAGWSRPGFARPLGGFFLFVSATLLALGPYLYVTAALVPSRVQPFPDVDGAWAACDELALLMWSLADLGMTSAFVQRFAERRVRDPAGALEAAQLFVWWELASGLLLFCAGGALACGILPHTRYALLSRVVLLRSTVQLFGAFGIFTSFFQAAQRFHYALGLDFLQSRLLVIALPIPLVLAGRAIGRAHAAVGETTGALAGIAAGQLAAAAVAAAIGLALYRRLKLPLAPLAAAGFSRRTFVELARFGLGVVASKASFFFANTVEIALLTALLPAYPTWLGIRNLIATKLVFVLWFAYPFFDSGVPAFAEALAARKHALARYYVVRYWQFGHLFTALMVAFLVGAGRPLVERALGAEWQPVATYLPLAALVGLLLPLAWTSDAFQRGAGRSGLDAALLVGEMTLRLVLLALLVPRLGFAAVFVAQLGGIAVKCAASWWINHRWLLRLELHAWTSMGAPLASGAALYGAIALAAKLAPESRAAAIALFAGSAIGAFPLGFFACGAIGGFDGAALDEIDRAAELSAPMRPIARALARCARLGARLAPVAARPLALAADAEREADELARA
ncbi:MAG TPA: hypothetical protein VFF06_01180 [Polyangia bacterium]|nr:hypothetical protein [Polyangia bacterium]